MNIHPLMVSLVLVGRDVLVLGGDDQALEKARALHAAGARVTVVSPSPDPDFLRWIRENSVPWRAHDPSPEDLCPSPFLVFSALRDPALSAWLWEASLTVGFLLCCADQPAQCSYTNLALARIGAVSLALGSGGAAPMLLKRLREDLVSGLRGDFEDFSVYLSELRAQIPLGQRRSELARALQGFRVELKVLLPEGWRARWQSLRAR